MNEHCVFRVDSGTAIGIGHVSRCLTLAEALRKRGMEVYFVCRNHPGAALEWIRSKGFPVYLLPVDPAFSPPTQYAAWLGDWQEDCRDSARLVRDLMGGAGWIVVDHYGIDERWETAMRRTVRRTLVIDDLADRRHACDLLLDQNVISGDPYEALVPSHAQVLLGPRYALLREGFQRTRESANVRGGAVRRVVVFFGGSDPTNETMKSMQAVRRLDEAGIEIDVIVGASNPKKDDVAAAVRGFRFAKYHCQVSDIERIYASADLALGAAGVSSWERLALGLPAVVVAVAENQVEIMRQLEMLGVAVALGRSPQIGQELMADAVMRLIAEPERLGDMSRKAFAVVDGRGTQRVVERMESIA